MRNRDGDIFLDWSIQKKTCMQDCPGDGTCVGTTPLNIVKLIGYLGSACLKFCALYKWPHDQLVEV